jgi:hypothetical protein
MSNNNIFTGQEGLPTQTQDPDFWRLVSDDNTRKCVVLLILDTLRRYNPNTGEDSDTRILMKLKGFQELIDLTAVLPSHINEDQSLPSDDPFSRGKEVSIEEQN